MNITKTINKWLCEREATYRDASFDFCFNYFRRFYEQDEICKLASEDNLHMSCLQLGFYLASWGMYRGPSFLLKKSVKHYESLMKEIAKPEMRTLWEIDVDKYTPENIDRLMKCKKTIKDALQVEKHQPETLVTKIMLGIFGNTPALDTYFTKGMKKAGLTCRTLNEPTLNRISQFYSNNKKDIDSFNIPTLDFQTGKKTNVLYTKAKLVDLAVWLEGNLVKTNG